MSTPLCPGCGRGERSYPRHSATCPNIDLETAKKYAGYFVGAHERKMQWVREYQRLEGKVAILKHENNKLRAKLRAANIIS